MPYRSIQFQAHHCYHLYNRGNNRQNIFFERENYVYFLKLLRFRLSNSKIDIIAYCLMPNHYHLLVKCQGGDISKGMGLIALSYTKAVNKRFNRSGSLFQGPFQAISVDTTTYLHHLVRYIHLNPVKAGLVDRPEDWEFSSYCEYAGRRAGTLPQIGFVQSSFSAAEEYRSWLMDTQLPMGAEVRTLMLDE